MGRTIKQAAAAAAIVAALAVAFIGGPQDKPHAGPPRSQTTTTSTTVPEVATSSTTLEAEVATSSATLEYGSLAHVHEAYDRHLAAHAAAYAAWEADPNGQDYAELLSILELRTAEYVEALAAWKAAG